MNNEIIGHAAEYATERVKKGFEFEVEGTIWHTVLEVIPHTVAASLGVSVVSGPVIVVLGCVTVLGTALVVRRRVRSSERTEDCR
jgi:hypothetical protein